MPHRYLLDTHIVSDLIRDPAGRVARRIAAVGEESVCTSIVVAAELRFGASKSPSRRLRKRVEQILEVMDVLAMDTPADRHYAEIRHLLERQGKPIGPNDLLIAAQARAMNLVVVTANTREFGRVRGLRTENWLDER